LQNLAKKEGVSVDVKMSHVIYDAQMRSAKRVICGSGSFGEIDKNPDCDSLLKILLHSTGYDFE
jgi:hypothetical protein